MATSPMFQSLRHRNARLFFSGLFVSTVGTWLQMTATGLLVYDLTGDAGDVGISMLCQFLPMLLLGAWAGVLADRHDRLRIVKVTQVLQALQALVLGVLALTDHAGLYTLYALSLILGVITAIDNPARRGFVTDLVEPQEISNAIALNTATMTSARIIGPALAGMLAHVLDIGWLFIANGVSFAFILWPLFIVDTSQLHQSEAPPRGGTPIRDAMRFVVRHPRLRVMFLVYTLMGTFSFNFSVSLLKLSDARFDHATFFGYLMAINGFGSMVGSLLTARRAAVSDRWLFFVATLFGVASLGIAWAPTFWMALVLVVPAGLGSAAFVASANSIFQAEGPPEMRGRLLALGAVAFLGSTPIGAPITGWIAERVSAEWSVAYGGVVALLSVALGASMLARA